MKSICVPFLHRAPMLIWMMAAALVGWMSPPASQAAVLGPYAPDSFTLHLWHLDESAVPAADGASGALALNGTGNGATFGNPSFTGFGSAVSLLDGGANGIVATDRDAYLQPLTTVNGAGDNINWSFADPLTGAYTFECIVRVDFDPAQNLGATAAGGNNRNAPLQIISGEQDSTGGGTRSWQFRLDPVGFNPNAGGVTTPLTQPTLEFIHVNNGAAPLQYVFAPIPTTGPDAIVQGNWYHVAATYNGNANTPDNFKIYWTLLSDTRSAAAVVVSANMTNDLVTGLVDFSIGNIGRGTPNGNFLGLVDEVRISSVARAADQMLFGASGVAPSFTSHPASQFVGEGDNVTLTAVASGSPPLTYQWEFNEAALPGQMNPALTLNGITSAQGGGYRLIAMNASGSATSQVAQVTVGARVREIFGTGVADDHTLLPANATDPHYELAISPDLDFPGPAATVFDDITPIPPYLANGPASKWIGPRLNVAGFTGNVVGNYIYRSSFVLDTVDPANTVVSGRWASDNHGADIRLNGTSLGISRLIDRAFETWGQFAISNGLVSGTNIIEFVVSNLPPPGATALRVDLGAVGLPRAAGLPQFVSQPSSRTVRHGGIATFSALVLGRPPLSLQWFHGDTAVAGATNRTLVLSPVSGLDHPGAYTLVASNASGAVTSQVAVLTVASQNQPVVAGNDSFFTPQDQPLTILFRTLLANDTEPDGDPISIQSFDTFMLTGTINVGTNRLTYTPATGFTGTDIIVAVLDDGLGGLAEATVSILVARTPLPEKNALRITRSPQGYLLELNSDGGRTNRIQRATDLGSLNWATIFTTNSPHGFIQFEDKTSPLPNGFYRAVSP